MCENLVQGALIKLCKKTSFQEIPFFKVMTKKNDFDREREREESAINLFRFIFKLQRNLCFVLLACS